MRSVSGAETAGFVQRIQIALSLPWRGFELFERCKPRLGRDAAERHAPIVFNFFAVRGFCTLRYPGSRCGQAADFPPAHRVGLAG